MNTFTFLTRFSAFFLMAMCQWVLADVREEGAYLGARAGYSYNQESCLETNMDCDKDDVGYGIFGGYDFNPRWGLELSLNDIGDSKARYPDGALDGDLRSADLSLKYTHPLWKQWDIYGKLGAAYWDAEVSGNNISIKDDGFRPLLGAGIQVPLSAHLIGRFEYQYIDQIGNDTMGHANPHFLGLALVWHFSPLNPPAKPSEPPPPVVAVAPEPEPIVEPQPEPEPLRIVIDEEMGGPLFEFDKAEIRNTAAIDQVVDMLLEKTYLQVSVIGHTDARGSAEYNQRLSETRANVVAKYLRAKGVTLDRIKVFGMGEDQPVADNGTDEGRARNRRVEFIITGTQTQP